MKNIILLLTVILLCLSVKAENDTCSNLLLTQNDTSLINNVDTSCDEMTFTEVDSTLEIKEIPFKSTGIKIKKLKKIKTKSKNPQDLGSFFSDLWDAISSLWKPVWGYYKENGMSHSGPYFLFNRESDNA
jgi:hypothetical protein